MAYDKATKKLWSEVDSNGELIGIALWEICDCLGYFKRDENGDQDLGMTIVNGDINMWASRKPICHPTEDILTDWKGSDEDQAKGIFYGIEIKGDTAITMKTLNKVHNIQFVYHRPTGGDDAPFRILDFDGYAHDATPNPYAYLPDVGYFNDGDRNNIGIDSIACRYRNGDTSGVDFFDMIKDVNVTDTLKKGFPAIVITKPNGKTYFTALKYIDDTYRPILVGNDDYAFENWYCTMSKKTYTSTGVQGGMASPFLSEEVVTASVIIIKSASAVEPKLGTAQDSINFGEYWVEVEDSTLALTEAVPVIVPNALGVQLTLKEYFKGVMFSPTGVRNISVQNNKPTFAVTYKEDTGLTTDKPIIIRADMTLTSTNGRQTATAQAELPNGWQGSSMLNQINVVLQDNIYLGEKYSGSVTLTTFVNGMETGRSQSLTFTNI